MTTITAVPLADLRDEAKRLEAAFVATVQSAGYADEWDAYRREIGVPWPAECNDAHDRWMVALHDYYTARDGSRGVLGSRGL
jgi:hypothetical protein